MLSFFCWTVRKWTKWRRVNVTHDLLQVRFHVLARLGDGGVWTSIRKSLGLGDCDRLWQTKPLTRGSLTVRTLHGTAAVRSLSCARCVGIALQNPFEPVCPMFPLACRMSVFFFILADSQRQGGPQRKKKSFAEKAWNPWTRPHHNQSKHRALLPSPHPPATAEAFLASRSCRRA